jgi:hypothetical protein
MVSESMMALAATAGAAIVDAAATGSWTTAKARVAELFAAGDDHRFAVVERRLEDTRTRLDAVPTRELESLRRRQTQSWATRLEDLLDERPETAERLRQILAELAGDRR